MQEDTGIHNLRDVFGSNVSQIHSLGIQIIYYNIPSEAILKVFKAIGHFR